MVYVFKNSITNLQIILIDNSNYNNRVHMSCEKHENTNV